MGIPHLLTHLQPYAVETPLTGTSLIIDGPSLAYHIWHLCSRTQDARPSYALLIKACIAWLNALQSHDTKITAIYFDGFLPPSKRPVRMDRLLKTTLKLRQLHQANPASCPEQYINEVDDITTFRKASDQRREPAHIPAFLVPAILEGLRASPFQPLVRLVPGEADVYCAQHALDEGGCVITTDSDLLVHDLGSGSVIMFWSLNILSPDGTPVQTLSTPRFTPTDIAKRLNLDPSKGGLRRFAYELTLNPNISLPQIVEACSKPVPVGRQKVAFKKFCKPYAPFPEERIMLEAKEHAKKLAGKLDPRVSEMNLQAISFVTRFLPSTFDPEDRLEIVPEEPSIFLPTLLDCPARTSAWQESLYVREAALTVYHSCYPPRWTFAREFRRTLNVESKGTKIRVIDPHQSLPKLLDTLTGIFDNTAAIIGNHPEFILVAHFQLDKLYSEHNAETVKIFFGEPGEDKVLTSVREFLTRPQSSASPRDWTTVHLAAQLQATYYSWRFFHQILPLVRPAYHPSERYLILLEMMHDYFNKYLPPLTQFPTPSSTIETLYRLEAAGLIPNLPQAQNTPTAEPTAKKRKAAEISAKTRRVSSNPFAMLDEE
ncbi:XPG domain containing-domain-containing protein [Plectosphaerella plurivora]|uniref:XPG domain containing-domain-containing protein n=1 Tax=Plectosphaerella plurivora TaxID=936078 RepID=A0A9P8V3R8_9PEZI|nr:XPG domain containing-domain-containing protein [Plectosphaerella plurivora]